MAWKRIYCHHDHLEEHMPKKRILFEGYMTVEGFHVELQEIDMETNKSGDKVGLTLPRGFMDQLFEKWQKFSDGTSEEHLLLTRTYFDDHPDMDYMKYFAMEAKRLEEKKLE